MKKRFNKINIEISNICNLKCSFCPEVIRTKSMMEPTLFRLILEQVTPLAEQVCLHLMGEPLAHPRLNEILDLCEEFKAPVFFVSNGVLLRDKQVAMLLRCIIKQVNFSLHSFFDNSPEADPTPYLERIFGFSERAFVERPELYQSYRLWNLEGPLGTGSKNGEMLSRIETRFGVKMRDGIDVRQQKSHLIKNRLYLNLDVEFVWPSLELPLLGEKGRCMGLSNHFGILVDGTVVPCCLDKEASIPLGKIQDQSILEILESKRANEMVRGFKQGKLIEELCKRCSFIERFKT